VKKTSALFVCACLILNFSADAFARRAPTLPNSYDGQAPSARSLAMASAGTGVPVNTEAVFFNTASLGYMYGTRALLSVLVSRKSSASLNDINRIEPWGQGLMSGITVKDTGGVSWQALSSYSMREDLGGGSWKNTEAYINAINISVGQKNEHNYSIGLNLTYLYGKIGESSYDAATGTPYSNIGSGNGFALDLGVLYPAGNNMFFGLNLKNIVGFMFWDDYNTEQLPISVRAGVGCVMKGFTTALDYDRKFYRFGDLKEDSIHYGVEQYINSYLSVRGGFITDVKFRTEDMTYTYGAGFRLKGYELSCGVEQSEINDKKFTKVLLTLSAVVL